MLGYLLVANVYCIDFSDVLNLFLADVVKRIKWYKAVCILFVKVCSSSSIASNLNVSSVPKLEPQKKVILFKLVVAICVYNINYFLNLKCFVHRYSN